MRWALLIQLCARLVACGEPWLSERRAAVDRVFFQASQVVRGSEHPAPRDVRLLRSGVAFQLPAPSRRARLHRRSAIVRADSDRTQEPLRSATGESGWGAATQDKTVFEKVSEEMVDRVAGVAVDNRVTDRVLDMVVEKAVNRIADRVVGPIVEKVVPMVVEQVVDQVVAKTVDEVVDQIVDKILDGRMTARVLSDLSVKQPSDVLRDLTEVVAELPTKPLDAVARDLVRALDPQIRRNVQSSLERKQREAELRFTAGQAEHEEGESLGSLRS